MAQSSAELAVGCLLRMAAVRPVFHSEADFQHEFAWRLHETPGVTAVRLERTYYCGDQPCIDVVARVGEAWWGYELKFWTRPFTATIDGEDFLGCEGAPDSARYDFWRDVVRLENLMLGGQVAKGCAIALTNDWLYWKPSSRPNTIGAAFDLREGREAFGCEMSWAEHASKGSKETREDPICLRGHYKTHWSSYNLARSGVPEFRYLLVEAAPLR